MQNALGSQPSGSDVGERQGRVGGCRWRLYDHRSRTFGQDRVHPFSCPEMCPARKRREEKEHHHHAFLLVGPEIANSELLTIVRALPLYV